MDQLALAAGVAEMRLLCYVTVENLGEPRHMTIDSADNISRSMIDSFTKAEVHTEPYKYFLVRNVLPEGLPAKLRDLPFPAPDLGGVSGTREVHNKSRSYFDVESRKKHGSCDAVAHAFQSRGTIASIESTFDADLNNTYLRIEYGQDTDGFWLQPHTDIGVKTFTMLLYLSDEEGHSALGTSIYKDANTPVGASPFAPNLAMIFVPSDKTWHGFEPRSIKGIRKSIIVNYVTDEWRAREQLAFPDQQISIR